MTTHYRPTEPELRPVHQQLLDRVPAQAGSDIRSYAVEYEQGDAPLEGFLAVDESSSGARPGVLVVHDWTGLDDYEQSRCLMLARLGYVAMGADIFGKGVRPQGDAASAKAGEFYRDPASTRARVLAALDELKKRPEVDPDRVAVMGYCFGGHVALQAAMTGAELAGVVTFHASLAPASEQDAAAVKARILVLNGGSDPVVPGAALTEFEASLRVAPDIDWQVITYSGAVHAFTVPTAAFPGRAMYDERSDLRSWAAMRAFFGEIFQ